MRRRMVRETEGSGSRRLHDRHRFAPPRAPAICSTSGLHTLCEKPLALTIRGCNGSSPPPQRSGKILSVAENYRRDPINRLVRALLDDGAIGERQFIMETAVRGRDTLFITPWRHQKLTGTMTLDAGVHNADILQYYFGDAASAYGQVRLYEKTRVRRDTAGPGGFYEKWAANLPPTIEATGEDAMFGLITFANGTLGQWIDHYAGHGESFSHRMVFGTRGSIAAPGDRNGRPVRLILDDGTDIADERVLDYAPSYRLDPVAGDHLRRRAALDVRLRLPDDRPQADRAGIRRVGRLHSQRHAAGSRRRGRPRAPSHWSTPSSSRMPPVAR